MKQLNAEIIAVGTELLLGQIANTNAQWISEQLAAYGVNVFYHGVVGDNLKRVEETFQQAKGRSDLIIVTGGLGPTDDDLTREAFQTVSNLSMYEHKPSMDKISEYFRKQKSEMTINNRKQARVFTDSEVIENKVGMAPGMVVSMNEQKWIFLPGVPREMKQMMRDDVLPYIQELMGTSEMIKSTVLRFIGIGEAKLEHEISDIIQSQQNPTIAPLAQNEGVVIRLTAKGNSTEMVNNLLQQGKQNILDRVGKFYYGVNEETIECKIVSLLIENHKTIAAAESLTGGLFTERVISVNGASAVCPGGVVCYDTTVKTNVLGVHEDTIVTNGAVSKECALEMATNIRNLLKTDIGISFTGVAGPDAIEGKPVGTVYIAICSEGQTIIEKFTFQGNRDAIRRKTILKGFELLFNQLK
ncbi:competence/damage-inducible protein A [Ornithinibacillus sp. L9]|uniref:Putative competence-damage inducible protein n=1 Tax=Ornithinibacillus caprae TaxID=2678566 RepID=A0A6N8FJL5_9BACI|nr:competence/damage-inducible protein A [Ornithinibacillus caprae]MUK89842.1 competence/damage-inducible protein A [Ornithinibacillus caprae]